MGLLDELAEIINPGRSPEIIGEINGRLAVVEAAVGLANVAFESEQDSRARVENIAASTDTLLKGVVNSPKAENNVVSFDEFRAAKTQEQTENVQTQATQTNSISPSQSIAEGYPAQQQMATEAREALSRLHGARHDEGSITVFNFRDHAERTMEKAA